MYKVVFFGIAFIITNFTNASAQTPPFAAERMLTDFAGVVTNGSTVLCYGNYGIITYSTDDGATWQQQTIGDKHNIKKIVALNGTYYGISNHAMCISQSNGKGWNFISVSDAIDLDIFNDSIYILTKTGILKADLTGKIQPIPITTLETSSTYTEMVVNDGYVFCIMDKRYIIRYSLTTKTQTKTDVITMYNPACSHCTHLAHLKKNKNELYVSIYLNMSGDIFTASLCTTTDSGVTYKPLTIMGAEFTGYTFDDSTMYAVRTRELRVPFLTAFSTDCYRVSSTNAQHLSVNDTIPDRHISYSEESLQRAQEFSDVIKIHDSILIAVGNKKLITRSTNGGKYWNTISYFNGSVNTLEHITCPTENLMYVKGVGNAIYHTTNGGITWLPQKYNGYPRTINHLFGVTYFDTKGNGFIVYTTRNPNDSNILVTHDYGETFTPIGNIELYHTVDTTITANPKFSWQYIKAIDIGGTYAIAGVKRNRTTSGDVQLPYNYLLRFDSTYRFIDSVIIKANTVVQLNKVQNGDMYALCMNSSGPTKSDSLAGLDKYTFSYFMMKSTNRGTTWDSISTPVPVARQTLKLGTKYYIVVSVLQSSAVNRGYILYRLATQALLRYNIATSTFDTLQIPTRFNANKGGMFTMDSTLYNVSLLQALYFTNTMHSSSVQWDSLQSSRLFEQWTPSQNNPNEENTDVIFGVEMINDSASVMVTSRTKKSVTANSPINFSKLRRTSFTTTIENLIEGSEYLWNSPPYPIPTINQISTQIFWENGFSLKDIKFQIYDVLGNQIPNPKINFEQTQQFAGLLHWNCEELPKGVYVIRVYISKNSILIPIIKL